MLRACDTLPTGCLADPEADLARARDRKDSFLTALKMLTRRIDAEAARALLDAANTAVVEDTADDDDLTGLVLLEEPRPPDDATPFVVAPSHAPPFALPVTGLSGMADAA